ncbi:hypothetical protein GCM10020331_082030 [Ectobacillus funiculus]
MSAVLFSSVIFKEAKIIYEKNAYLCSNSYCSFFGAIAFINRAETTQSISDNQLSAEEQKKQETYYTNKTSSDELGKQLDAKKNEATVYFFIKHLVRTV